MEVTLPVSGKTATIRRPTGHDMIQAELLCGSDTLRPMALQYAMLSRVTMIDGKTLPYEDFLDLDAEDLRFLGELEPSRPEPYPEPPASF